MVRVYSAAQVHAALPWAALGDALHAAFVRGAQVPLRHAHALAPTDTLLLMPAWDDRLLITKLVTVIPGAPSTVEATVMAMDRTTGHPLAVLDGEALTLRRTAATSALAARHLALPEVEPRVEQPAFAPARVRGGGADAAEGVLAGHEEGVAGPELPAGGALARGLHEEPEGVGVGARGEEVAAKALGEVGRAVPVEEHRGAGPVGVGGAAGLDGAAHHALPEHPVGERPHELFFVALHGRHEPLEHKPLDEPAGDAHARRGAGGGPLALVHRGAERGGPDGR
jgi:hypothetical protein